MKTSIKLLLGLAVGLIVAMFGAAVSIRQQFDRLDKTDSYASWQKKPLPAFRAVHITGPSATIVQIEPGSATRLLADSLTNPEAPYTYRVERDTLFLHLGPVDNQFYLNDQFDLYHELQNQWHDPQLVVQAPSLSSVSTKQARCQIRQLKGDKLTLNQQGKGCSTLLDKLELNQLTASLSGHSRLVLYSPANRITQGTITVSDSAWLFQYTDFSQGLTIKADPGAHLHLTGKSLQQIQSKGNL